MSETMTGAELARLILRPGTTAAEVAAMDVEDVAKVVAYRRRKKARGPADPAMTDEQIARTILEYAQSDPSDWPVAPGSTIRKQARRAWLLGALGGGVGGFVFVIVGAIMVVVAGIKGDYAVQLAFLGALFAPAVALLSAILGAALALVATRGVAGTGLRKRVPLATGLAISFILAFGFWLYMLAREGELNQFIPRSADSLIEGYQAGRRDFDDWNLRGADLSRADLTGANLYKADLRDANLDSANLSGANLIAADLDDANLSKADLRDANLDSAKLSGAKLSDAKLHGARLFSANMSGVDLSWAELSGLYLSGAWLQSANLSGADLSGADLSWAWLHDANLSGANLGKADLSGARLHGANLSKANLLDAKVTQAQLDEAASLEGATMPDGTVHE